jgi:ubiquitin C-terminal hydrolase
MDAQEFFGRFIDKVEESLKDTSQKYLIADMFQGQSASQLVCPKCGFSKTAIEDWTTL